MYLKTLVFILTTREWKEGDRVFSLYSREIGKIEAQARGVRKAQSKLAGNLQPFRLIDIHLARGKMFHQIIGAQTEHRFKIRELSLETGYGYYFLELVDSLTKVGQQNEEIFDMLYAVLEFLEKESTKQTSVDEERFKRLRIAFLLKLLRVTGFSPEKRIKRNGAIQEVLDLFLEGTFEDIVSCDMNGELKQLFNISQHTLNEVVERPLNSVVFLKAL